MEKKINLISKEVQRTHTCNNCGHMVNSYLKYEINANIVICNCVNNSIKTKYVQTIKKKSIKT